MFIFVASRTYKCQIFRWQKFQNKASVDDKVRLGDFKACSLGAVVTVNECAAIAAASANLGW